METGKLKLFPFNLTSRAEKRLSFYLWNGESNETFTGDDRTPAGSENVQNYSVCAIIFHLLQCKYKNISLKEQSHELVNTIFCLTDSSWALHEHEQATVKRFHDFFSNFHEDTYEINVCQVYVRTREFSLMQPPIFIFLNYCYWVCEYTQVLFFA